MLPISDRWARRLEELGCPREKIAVHRLGVDTRAFAFHERHARPNEGVRLLSVCRLAEKKGVEYALRAIALLRSRSPELRYDIVGDGPLRGDLEKLVIELDLSDRVVFHGACRREEVAALVGAAHVFVAPSVTARDGDQEGIPVAIMEAMASGLPVVSTRHGGIPELVHDGATGALVGERDVAGLARALHRLLDDRPSWARLGREGRRVVETEYDLERQNDRLEQRLFDLVSSARSKR
jgi:colanic acid/amylovoran biosynthesis glycosyltransferase